MVSITDLLVTCLDITNNILIEIWLDMIHMDRVSKWINVSMSILANDIIDCKCILKRSKISRFEDISLNPTVVIEFVTYTRTEIKTIVSSEIDASLLLTIQPIRSIEKSCSGV